MDYRDNRQRWAESHQVVHFYAGQWCTFTPALTEIEKKSYGVTDEEAQSTLDALNEKADAAKQEREIKEDMVSQQAERNDTIKKNCEIARSNLELLTSQARVTLKDDDGNDYFLTDEDKQAKTLDARANVDRYCTN